MIQRCTTVPSPSARVWFGNTEPGQTITGFANLSDLAAEARGSLGQRAASSVPFCRSRERPSNQAV